jgi:redox-sensitive bicupin YhaK (pirin superfamily)
MRVKPKNSDFDKMKIGMENEARENQIVHRANSRGQADHGWLKVNHSFSFAQWYDPKKVNFGALRVLNDDYVAANKGFGTHPHDNMEIITIPLAGELSHKDSMGNASTIHAGEIQVMSAGQGILHSEINSSLTETANVFQIWIFPNKKDVEPRYDQRWINTEKTKDKFIQLVSPNSEDEGTWIHQNAWINTVEFDQKEGLTYSMNDTENGIYTMVIEGEATLNGEILNKRDAIGIWNQERIEFKAKKGTKMLIIEVPMHFEL